MVGNFCRWYFCGFLGVESWRDGWSQFIVASFVQWCQYNALVVNIAKTEFVFFEIRNSLVETILLQYQNQQLKRSGYVIFLGIILCENLKWCEHVNYVIRKLSSSHYAIRRVLYHFRMMEFDWVQRLLQAQKRIIRTIFRIGALQTYICWKWNSDWTLSIQGESPQKKLKNLNNTL